MLRILITPICRALLVGAAVLALLGAAQAQPRVGVTQSTENKPIGKPPSGPDRVLVVGTDIQANETIITANDDRAHVVFLDGTTVTLGPNSSLTIDKFVYDPTTKQGELALSSGAGVFRLIGGRISKTSEVTVKTTSATLGIRGGISIWAATPGGDLKAMLQFGSLKITGQGPAITLNIPGLTAAATPGGLVVNTGFTLTGDLGAAMLALKTTATPGQVNAVQAALADAIDKAVKSGQSLSVQSVLQAFINAVAGQGLLTAIQQTTTTFIVPENPNQAGASPN